MRMTAAERRTSPPKAAKRLHFGPQDHGVEASDDVFERAEYEPGFKYEVIDGRLYVSPQADKPHANLINWVFKQLSDYQQSHPKAITQIHHSSRVFVPGHRKTVCPEPDLAVYNRSSKLPLWTDSWKLVSPVVVIEVCSGDLDKDLHRNVVLYEQVPSILEYWVVYPGDGPASFFFRAYVKRGSRWAKKPHNLHIGDTYKTPLFPGFALRIDPR